MPAHSMSNSASSKQARGLWPEQPGDPTMTAMSTPESEPSVTCIFVRLAGLLANIDAADRHGDNLTASSVNRGAGRSKILVFASAHQ